MTYLDTCADQHPGESHLEHVTKVLKNNRFVYVYYPGSGGEFTSVKQGGVWLYPDYNNGDTQNFAKFIGGGEVYPLSLTDKLK